MKPFLLLSLAAGLCSHLSADPKLTSWFTANSGQYARIYQTTAAETAGTKSTTWTRGQGTQANPVYADVHEIAYSANWVYLRSSGLASHTMGPWYLNAAKTTNFPNFPANTAVTYRIPRTPTIPTTKTLTGLGATGRMVNGVSMFDSRDAFSYKNSSAQDATPVNGLTGDGIWNRDGYHNEGVTFDPALAHQAGSNYHYHAHPIGLRFQLGDHVDYNATTNRYTEKAGTPASHSPIVAWAADGIPVYGPYGYSSAMDASSGIRRMIAGFALRNGQNGTTAITVRQVLPAWAKRVQNKTTLTAAQYGPAVNATYLLGHYIEDFDYRGDLGQTLGVDFDLNEQNVRFCVTPEYPAGTWAYFTPINADGTPQYPYTTGRQYYGSPTGGSTTTTVMNADTPLTTHFRGGPNKALTVGTPSVSGTTVTLTWSAVEGGTYAVEASKDQAAWTAKGSKVSTGISSSTNYTSVAATGSEYARVTRTALATYDTNGFTAATVAQTATTTVVITLSTQADGLPDTWKLANGLDPLSASSANGPDGDPDHDGRSNLVEYALNTAANTSQTSPLTQSLATNPGDGLTYLTFTYPRLLGTTGLTYTVQASADLATWPSPGTSVQELSVVPDGNGVTETVTVRLLPAVASESKLFVRLLVSAD